MHKSSHTAAAVLERAVQLIGTDIEAWLGLFAQDAVVEFPYARALGHSPTLQGKDAIAAYFRPAVQAFTQLHFRDLRIDSGADPDIAFAQVHGSAVLMPGAHAYEQDYVMWLRTKAGRVTHYIEYWNPLELPDFSDRRVQP
jgi:ketosteroid isomerase-like protein